MDALRSEGFGGNYYDPFGATILAAAIAGSNRNNLFDGVDFGTLINTQGIGDIRRDVTEAEAEIRSDVRESACDVKDSVHDLGMAAAAEFRAIGMKLCDIEKENVETKYAITNTVKDAENRLSRQLADGFCDTSKQMSAFENNVNKQFCDLSHQIERGFCDLKETDLRNTIDQLRRDNTALATLNQNKDIISAVGDLIKKV